LKMFKFVVAFAAVFACALAAGTFTPDPLPCAYHVYSESVGYSDYYMLTSESTGYVKLVNVSSGDEEFIRCDVKNEKGQCIYITHYKESGECETEWCDGSEDYLNMTVEYGFLRSPFEYETGPLDVDCPNHPNVRGNISSHDCKKYENAAGEYIIVDNNNLIVQSVTGYVVTYTDDVFDVSIYKTTDCTGKDLGVPEDVCREGSSSSSGSGSLPSQVFTPKELPCAYHVYSNTFGYSDYYMLTSESTGYVKLVNMSSGDEEFLRCDVKNDKGQCIYITHYKNGECETEWCDESLDYLNVSQQYHLLRDPFEYVKVEDAYCPNVNVRGNISSHDCKKYTNAAGEYIIADSNGYIVRPVNGYIITYTDDVFDVSIYNTTDCSGKDLGVPVDVCKKGSSSSTTSQSSKTSAASYVIVSYVVVALAALVALF